MEDQYLNKHLGTIRNFLDAASYDRYISTLRELIYWTMIRTPIEGHGSEIDDLMCDQEKILDLVTAICSIGQVILKRFDYEHEIPGIGGPDQCCPHCKSVKYQNSTLWH